MKKILILSQYFTPDINAASFRITDMYTELEKLGHEITVVTAEPQKASLKNVNENKFIYRIPLKRVKKKSFISYISNYFGFMFKSFFTIVFKFRKEKYDYLIVTSPPLFVGLSGVLAAKIKKSKLILDIRDIWPDSAVAAGMLKENGILYKISSKIERYIYKTADIITCVSQPMKQYIKSINNKENIYVLYNGVSLSKEDCFVKYSSFDNFDSKKLNIAYAGNLGIVQNLYVLVEAMKLLDKDRYHLTIIGDGIEKENIKKIIKEENINNITMTGPMLKEDVFKTLNKMDLLYLSLVDDKTFDYTIPSKLFDYLLSNKPILTSIKGEGQKILQHLDTAVFFEWDNVEDIVIKLKECSNNKDFYYKKSSGNSLFVIENYNRNKIFKTFFEDIM